MARGQGACVALRGSSAEEDPGGGLRREHQFDRVRHPFGTWVMVPDT
jgi:hypothetical protein